MAGDLGTRDGEVHEKARAVLGFWFDEVPPEQRFAKDDALDRTIKARFANLFDDLVSSGAAGWRDDAETVLAAIIVLDQFSRNMHRGQATAFTGDPLAQELSKGAIGKGLDGQIATERRAFLYMPLMHAEDAETQRLSIACFEKLGDAENVKYARAHADVIARFGRFPGRNAALGQKSTPEEKAYLSQPSADW